jgi:hypothetical protein
MLEWIGVSFLNSLLFTAIYLINIYLKSPNDAIDIAMLTSWGCFIYLTIFVFVNDSLAFVLFLLVLEFICFAFQSPWYIYVLAPFMFAISALFSQAIGYIFLGALYAAYKLSLPERSYKDDDGKKLLIAIGKYIASHVGRLN